MHAGYPLLDDLLALLFSHPQVYVELSMAANVERRPAFHRFLRGIVDAGYADRAMFGSDNMIWPGLIDAAVRGIEQATYLTSTQRRGIFYDNAARFLRRFVRLDLFDEEQVAGMRTGPHSGCHVHPAAWVSEDDRASATRHARHCARKPVALERLPDDRTAKAVTDRSDTSDGPTAGTETVDPLEFLARVLVHIPDTGRVTTRYDGWDANRPRAMRRQAEPAEAERPPAGGRRSCSSSSRSPPRECPRCHGVMRLVACSTPPSVIDLILAHRRARVARAPHAGPQSPPSTLAPTSRGASRAPRPPAAATTAH